MRTALAAFAALVLAAPAAADERPEWVGVWQGTVGSAPVRVCLDAYPDSPGRGSYYYMAHLQPIALADDADEGGWIERGPAFDVQAHWDFAELTASRAHGTWRQGKRRVPFSLAPVAWTDGQAEESPCASAAFMQPRLGGGRVVSEPGRIPGLVYTVHRYAPARQFVDLVEARSFSFEPQQAGDAAVVRQVAALVPMPGDSFDNDVWQCVASGVATSGVDGSLYQSVEPKMAVGPYLTVEVSSESYCGGAHPDHATYHRTYDRISGEEVHVDAWIGTPGNDGAVVMPAGLRERVIARWPADPDLAECREVASETNYWDVELRRGGLAFTPSFPHALRGCEETVILEWPALEPYLDSEGRAGLARLRGGS